VLDLPGVSHEQHSKAGNIRETAGAVKVEEVAPSACYISSGVGIEPTTNGLTDVARRSRLNPLVRKQALSRPVARETTPRYTSVQLAGKQVGNIGVLTMNPLIESNPAVMMGKPVIRGTRLTVEGLLDARKAQDLTEKLRSLPPQHQAEVEDFVEFLLSRDGDLTGWEAAGKRK
jgi:uncharacterized protein (DUF433 family)